ncbi:hypothetical protein [Flavobacterium sp.]|uniref:hypothetical protein n=1 Tax=Flavobacterium sp. TaxID=239 RepID=UPI002623F057|nr:hypothetical protein [Flavobacterium sp.]
MKKIIGLFALMLTLNGCDDGDITIEDINFEDVTASYCDQNDILYKIKDNEALLIQIENSENFFTNEVSDEGDPTVITINNTTNRVIYRAYSGEVATGNICATIPLSTPSVIEEWVATSGTIEITTTANVVPNTTSTAGNATKITGYTYYIEFKNVTFLKPNGVEQLYETYVFGDRIINSSLPFAFNVANVVKCDISSNVIYNVSGKESLVLNLDSSFFTGTLSPNIKPISATNKVTYKLFETALTTDYFCTSPFPATPILSEEWNGVDGVGGVSGEIEVIATEVTPDIEYTIHLKKVTLKRGNAEFYLGDDYIYGTFIN